ncbi:MAG: polysaccharide deacetylase family protein [Bacteroides sp.]|nr:polysaccharide deacetylase family protein [Eubacterium sp.]MCM1418343.1 polysaccharide deacetylase family protein [Roseburia sp.]MCM1462825.1 polysaccharide deacetylase family protein [Bacteroides sp.]
MKIKRFFCALTAAAVIGSLSGCFSTPEETGSGSSTTTPPVSDSGSGSDSSSDTMPPPAGTGNSESSDSADSSDSSSGADEPTESGDGEYNADEDGIVSDGGDNANEPSEAAYASPYMIPSAIGAIPTMRIAANGLSLTKIGWGLGKETDGDNRPLDAVSAEEKYRALGARFLPEGKKICLTFDEGYENGYTAEILDILAERNVKAVFFVTYDYCRTSPELVQRMIDEGHTVGNHSYTHPSLPDCSENEIIEEVSVLHDYVAAQFGYEMTLFRFPKGEFSESALSIVQKLGYTSVFWSFAYSDWDTAAQPDPAEALKKIKASTHAGVYLLHAVSATNTQILGDLLDHWKAEGYTVGADL